MKIIVSHDVDHLYGTDHLRDLIYPKLWVRETLAMLRKNISGSEWARRMISPFQHSRNHIEEVMNFDEAHGVRSTFFFGMEKGLGMSYDKSKAQPFIERVRERGFLAGVHGIAYNDAEKIAEERKAFAALSSQEADGIRMHYVRYDDNSFKLLADCGYKFDSTEFDKKSGCCIKAPYKIGDMWEFPLCVMDGYLPYPFEQAKARTLELLRKAEEINTGYFTVLFHDYMFCDGWKQSEDWYRWLVEFFEKRPEYSFVSYLDAIDELEKENA